MACKIEAVLSINVLRIFREYENNTKNIRKQIQQKNLRSDTKHKYYAPGGRGALGLSSWGRAVGNAGRVVLYVACVCWLLCRGVSGACSFLWGVSRKRGGPAPCVGCQAVWAPGGPGLCCKRKVGWLFESPLGSGGVVLGVARPRGAALVRGRPGRSRRPPRGDCWRARWITGQCR